LSSSPPARAPWRDRVREIIFEADTVAGRLFDVLLLVAILLSVATIVTESVPALGERYGRWFQLTEWAFTLVFTAEYLLRLATAIYPLRYARSFFGVVDLVSILPTYLSLLLPGSESLLVIRSVRLLRVFRVFKLGRYLGGAELLRTALLASRHKILVFLGTVLVLVVIVGSAMYLIEGPEHGFDSIPHAMYWAIVTMTTVGYGDLVPQTTAGRFLAAAVMIMGYSIIAIPTGIVTAEIAWAGREPITTRVCPGCFSEGHSIDARFCRDCGERLVAQERRVPS